jgi:predicted lipoprotein with Yx(FWY)xxD motif
MDQVTDSTKRRAVSWRAKLTGSIAGGLLAVGVLAVGISGAHVSEHSTKGVVISTATSTKYGTYVISGHTVYVLAPSKVACNAACLKYWPQVLLPKGVTKATAGAGVSSSDLGTLKLKNGRRQVTYSGKALFKFSKDTAAGQVKGIVKDTWGKWSIIVTVPPTSTTTTTSGGGGIGF